MASLQTVIQENPSQADTRFYIDASKETRFSNLRKNILAKGRLPVFANEYQTQTIHNICHNSVVKQKNKTYFSCVSWPDSGGPELNIDLLTPLWVDDNIRNAPDGPMTYIIVVGPDSKTVHVVASLTIAPQEIGTKHYILTARAWFNGLTEENPLLLIAGELDKRGSSIEINFCSGTYSEALQKKFQYDPKFRIRSLQPSLRRINPSLFASPSKEFQQTEFEAILKRMAQSVFRQIGIPNVKIPYCPCEESACMIVNNASRPYTVEQFQDLIRLGYEVHMFPTPKTDEEVFNINSFVQYKNDVAKARNENLPLPPKPKNEGIALQTLFSTKSIRLSPMALSKSKSLSYIPTPSKAKISVNRIADTDVIATGGYGCILQPAVVLTSSTEVKNSNRDQFVTKLGKYQKQIAEYEIGVLLRNNVKSNVGIFPVDRIDCGFSPDLIQGDVDSIAQKCKGIEGIESYLASKSKSKSKSNLSNSVCAVQYPKFTTDLGYFAQTDESLQRKVHDILVDKLQQIHAVGVIHFDIKRNNIAVIGDPENSTDVRFADFGESFVLSSWNDVEKQFQRYIQREDFFAKAFPSEKMFSQGNIQETSLITNFPISVYNRYEEDPNYTSQPMERRIQISLQAFQIFDYVCLLKALRDVCPQSLRNEVYQSHVINIGKRICKFLRETEIPSQQINPYFGCL